MNLQVLAINTISYKDQESGQMKSFRRAECVGDVEGQQRVFAIILKDNDQTRPGRYVASWVPFIDRTGRLRAYLGDLAPVAVAAPKAA